jgi:arylsulfatase A-like enzyme
VPVPFLRTNHQARRTRFLAITIGGLALVLSAVGLWRVADGSDGDARGSERRPNVLIIVTDDQRSGLSVMPETRRWFVERGTRFSNMFVSTPVCCPSRATIFSGRYAHNHQVQANTDSATLKLDHRSTLQRYLQDAGYRTGIFGKLLNGWDISRDPPYFDDWSIISRAVPGGYLNGKWNERGTLKTISEYSTTYLADNAIRFLSDQEDDDDRPWFLYISTTAPHTPPYHVEPKYENMSVPPTAPNPAMTEEDRSDKPPHVRNEPREESRREIQLRLLMSVDDLVERVTGRLETLEEDNTLAVYVSDNGYLWGEHGLDNKSLPYLPSVRVPMMIRWPDRIDEGMIDDRLAANVDIAPTVLDAVGLSPDDSWPHDGRSLLESWSRDRILTEYWQPPPEDREGLLSKVKIPAWASLTTPRYQYTEYYRRDERTPRFRELYNLEDDPWQLSNLLADKAARPADAFIERLSRRLARDRTCEAEACP